MDDPSVCAVVGKAGEEDAAAEKVEPPHAVTAWVPFGTGLEILRGSGHHRRRKCLALLPRHDLAEPESEGIDDIRHGHRVRRRMAVHHSP